MAITRKKLAKKRISDLSKWHLLLSDKFKIQAVCPAKTILHAVFTARWSGVGVFNVVFLKHFSRFFEYNLVGVHPPFFDGFGQGIKAVISQAYYGHPLQAGPAVGAIPLLACLGEGGHQAAFFQKVSLQNHRYLCRPCLACYFRK